jgi:hypothetical protein
MGARAAKREHVTRINAALGADAVGSADYRAEFPKRAFCTHDLALALDELIRVPGSPGGG